jgi:GntR family transcriptional regulator, transcriptional repressor for pyruvate dehydrogenase complex
VIPQQVEPVSRIAGHATEGVRSPKASELVTSALRRMIVDGQLTDGDFLPRESELMEHFRVSRPTLREAVRVLEAERLVEVRRGSRTGARVRVPGPEIIARPAALLLELAGTTLSDVVTARLAIEPYAARLLAENGTQKAHNELAKLVAAVPAQWEAGEIAHAAAMLHRRLVELSGNATLSIIAGMLYEITERHTTVAVLVVSNVTLKADYTQLIRSFNRLVKLVKARDGAGAEAHWRKHMEISNKALLKGHERTRVRDIMD